MSGLKKAGCCCGAGCVTMLPLCDLCSPLNTTAYRLCFDHCGSGDFLPFTNTKGWVVTETSARSGDYRFENDLVKFQLVLSPDLYYYYDAGAIQHYDAYQHGELQGWIKVAGDWVLMIDTTIAALEGPCSAIAATGTIVLTDRPVDGDVINIDDGVYSSKHFEFDAGAAATGSLRVTSPSDGNSVTISDGATAFTFEFDSGGGVSPGNIAVLIGVNNTISMTNLIAAINAQTWNITALPAVPPDNTCTLANATIGSVGNVPINSWSGSISWTGMSGGADPGEGISSGNIGVVIGGSKESTMANLIVAINTAAGFIITATNTSAGNGCDLVNDVAGSFGNVAITKTCDNATITGMAGGTDALLFSIIILSMDEHSIGSLFFYNDECGSLPVGEFQPMTLVIQPNRVGNGWPASTITATIDGLDCMIGPGNCHWINTTTMPQSCGYTLIDAYTPDFVCPNGVWEVMASGSACVWSGIYGLPSGSPFYLQIKQCYLGWWIDPASLGVADCSSCSGGSRTDICDYIILQATKTATGWAFAIYGGTYNPWGHWPNVSDFSTHSPPMTPLLLLASGSVDSADCRSPVVIPFNPTNNPWVNGTVTLSW